MELWQVFQQNNALAIVAIGILSLCVGSFLNVVIFRTPKIMQQEWDAAVAAEQNPGLDTTPPRFNLSTPKSHCPQCGTALKPLDNIPVLSWLLLKAKCRYCQHPIPIRYPAIELSTAMISMVIVWLMGFGMASLLAVVMFWVLWALFWIDFDTQLLPDRLTLPLIGLGLLVNSFSVLVTPQMAIWGAVLGFMILWSINAIFRALRGIDGMGYGDFKLLAALGAWLGAAMLPLILLMSSLTGLLLGLLLLLKHKESRPFAFGPSLILAGIVCLLFGQSIIKWYLSIGL